MATRGKKKGSRTGNPRYVGSVPTPTQYIYNAEDLEPGSIRSLVVMKRYPPADPEQWCLTQLNSALHMGFVCSRPVKHTGKCVAYWTEGIPDRFPICISI